MAEQGCGVTTRKTLETFTGRVQRHPLQCGVWSPRTRTIHVSCDTHTVLAMFCATGGSLVFGVLRTPHLAEHEQHHRTVDSHQHNIIDRHHAPFASPYSHATRTQDTTRTRTTTQHQRQTQHATKHDTARNVYVSCATVGHARRARRYHPTR